MESRVTHCMYKIKRMWADMKWLYYLYLHLYLILYQRDSKRLYWVFVKYFINNAICPSS
jgi:hypothetical protein